MLNTKSWTLAALVCGALVGAADARPEAERFTFAEIHMGTRFRIVLYAADDALAKRASSEAFARIAALDAMLSDYRPESELMQLCRKAGGPPTHVSDELYFVLE